MFPVKNRQVKLICRWTIPVLRTHILTPPRHYMIYLTRYVWAMLTVPFHHFFQGGLPLNPPGEIPIPIIRQMGRNQPHPYVFYWAKTYNIQTDSIKVIKAVLISENLKPRSCRCVWTINFVCFYLIVFCRRGEKRENYIFYLNQMLDDYLKLLNERMDTWPNHWASPNIFRDMVNAFQFQFGKLHKQMRTLVRQKQSDRNTTPSNACVEIPPSVYFAVTRGIGDATFVSKNMIASCEVTSRDLDCIFIPTEEDRATDGKVHPHYHHSIQSRWYDQYYDLDTVSTVEGALVPWAANMRVDERHGVSLEYNLHTYKFRIDCIWTGRYKRPNQKDWDTWIEGVVG